MKRFLHSQIVTVGLAIFSMFFGAGNLIFPLKVGLTAGQNNIWAILGFLTTGVFLPLLGLISIILFNGDYKAFFYRLGRIPGAMLILFCMLIIGPLVAMPRIVTLSHIMVGPFIGNISLPFFTLLFLGITFLGTYKENKIISLLGHIISPILLVSLLIIIIKGLVLRGEPTSTTLPAFTLFWESLTVGYNTLDLLGAIFFSSIVITILRENLKDQSERSLNKLAIMGFKAGTLGVCLLAIIYVGMSFLGVYHGQGLNHLNEGELFSAISFRILGSRGAIIIALAVLMACYSTIIALAAVVSEYLQHTIFRNKINYLTALVFTLGLTGIISNFGLSTILSTSGPFIEAGYPILVALTLINVAYKAFGFKYVKVPVLITVIILLLLNRMS